MGLLHLLAFAEGNTQYAQGGIASVLGVSVIQKGRQIGIMKAIGACSRQIARLYLTTTGRPMIANDPHLALGTPSTFYPMGLHAFGRVEVFGSGFAGVPGVVQGYNRHLAWGTTNNAIDVTDTYAEQLVPAKYRGSDQYFDLVSWNIAWFDAVGDTMHVWRCLPGVQDFDCGTSMSTPPPPGPPPPRAAAAAPAAASGSRSTACSSAYGRAAGRSASWHRP